ncbi:MAG TPA: hypothetical protein VFE78_11515, partial [Gemmataceae bacterium]|nr:hypothetical protein [Gemmataceae bacterium]
MLRAPAARSGRRAVVLLVVLLLLTLFAVLGLSFVLYADAAASSARLHRQAQSRQQPDAGPDLLLAHFLGQFLYDVPDDAPASGLRGHSLARLLYGYHDEGVNAVPFNGTGRLHAPGPLPGVDDYHLVNYTYFPQDGFLRDPERLGWRSGPDWPRGPYAGGANVPYTYPDLNNLFLAAVRADGTVLARSYHRDWLFNPGRPLGDRTNPNWTNAAGKYLTLRPRPAEHPGFPYPEDGGGDVKNLPGTPGLSDSIWIDLDFPVLTTPDGSKFKPLFAPLVVDLDGRVNVNAHGNVRGRDRRGLPLHLSNQGWGPWEVSLGRVLTKQSAGRDEWPNLLLGAGGRAGRYGTDGRPGAAGAQAPPTRPPHGYAQADFDGGRRLVGRFAPGLRFLLPGAGASPLQPFPLFPAGYDDFSGGGALTERWEHPALANPLQTAGDDRPFEASDLEALLRRDDTGGPSLASRLLSLAPANFSDPRLRRLLTTHALDLNAAGVSPWVYDPTLYPYAAGPDGVPAGPPVPFPNLALRNTEVPANSDFGAPQLPPGGPGVDWRCLPAGLGRVNLNQRLTPYPLPAPQAAADYAQRFDVPALADQFQQAQRDRQQLADGIYTRLLAVAGVPRSAAVADQPTDAELQVRRWLAQLAANVVDYLDEDDVATPFNFYTVHDAGRPDFDIGACNTSGNPPQPDPELPRYWVFGTELPHVVVNEALAEYRDLAAAPTQVRVWVELHNPVPAPTAGRALQAQDGLPVRFQIDGAPQSVTNKPAPYAPYRVVLATGLEPRPLDDNVLGKPAVVRTRTADGDFAAPAPLAGGGTQAAPSPAVGPGGFFLLGPQGGDARNAVTAAVPAATPWLQTASLEYRHAFAPGRPREKAAGLTVLLRRLANPHLPFDPNPRLPGPGDAQVNPWYNPYLTVDSLTAVPLRDAAGAGGYASWGKRQPYAADTGQCADQAAPSLPTQHTFGRVNNPAPASGRYDWLVHLDRELISPMELLHVSACRPHQLTQRFLTAGGKFGHYAPWFDQTRRLYRVFEFLEARSQSAGGLAEANGRMAGKINLNTVWDAETFLALCDPQPANGPNFTADEVARVYNAMLALRTPGGTPGPDDRPFLGLAAGYSQANSAANPDPQHPSRGAGINDTLLRAATTDADAQPGGGAALPRLFGVPNEEHPYRQAELLTKVFNNVTTRSNV